MDPGAHRDEVEVVYRTETNTVMGKTFTSVSQGSFWAMIVFITRALAYSGGESLSQDKLKAIIPSPVVRFTFLMDYEFNFDTVEFHYLGRVYRPRDYPIRIGGTGGSRIVYNCYLDVVRSTS